MKKVFALIIALAVITLSCTSKSDHAVKSPDKATSLTFGLNEQGVAYYQLVKNGKTLIKKSNLWFEFNSQKALKENMTIVSVKEDKSDSKWTALYGEDQEIRDNYTSMLVSLKEKGENGRKWNIHFKLFDDGLGFRYEFPEQATASKDVVIKEEHTEFNLTEDATAWWIPADFDSYEYIYQNTKLSEVDAKLAGYAERGDRHIHDIKAVNTPLTIKLSDGTYMAFHEANLTDYAGMTLGVKENNQLVSELVPWKNGDKVRTAFPFVSPWRVVLVGDKAGDLVENKIVLNLNEPCKEKNLSWIKPMKYTGIWWEMHVGATAWCRVKKDANGKLMAHGANTENAMKYIDFNAANNIQGLLFEGWNDGWASWDAGNTRESFDFTKPYADFDIDKIVAYAKKKGVAIVGHHETGGDVPNYEKQLEAAMAYYKKYGIHAVKTGYAGALKPKGQFHHGQLMVKHYRRVVECAFKNEVAVIAHEPIKATGLRRTLPNMMTREGVRGMEYQAWGGGNPITHTLTLPFTRQLSGPIDYTPGIFDVKFAQYKKDQFVRSTVARQLAEMVIIYSPLVMAADMIDNYKGNPAFQFVRDFNADCSVSKVLEGAIGEYITVARKEKNSDSWFVGCGTAKTRTTKVDFSFLDADKEYTATIYKDGKDTHWMTNPTPVEIKTVNVNSKSTLDILLAEGGGCAMVIKVK